MASRLLFSCTLGKRTLGCTHTSARRRTRAHARTHTHTAFCRRPFGTQPAASSQQPAAISNTHFPHTHTHTRARKRWPFGTAASSQQPAASSSTQTDKHINKCWGNQTTSLDLNGTVCEYTMVAKQKKAFRELWSPSSQVV